ncbi:MAG TPA: glutamine-hydrolyzing GMP synthase [Candidatus Cloacimonadota bacterium]|nr:glutamine-hydrolyzing GMP synthase [Candidatus Cloacimonadota bacterium]HPT72693.1 glutamine-hydrolyzing GMP synthase [Candidatus Cloacimonadota bacterium]
MLHEVILILDFGSQYTQLIAKTIRSMNVYCEIVPYNVTYDAVEAKNPKAIILSGSPSSVTFEFAPIPDIRILEMPVPILGICYGMQLISHLSGAAVESALKKEYGFAEFLADTTHPLFQGLEKKEIVWMSHGDSVMKIPEGFRIIGESANTPIAAVAHVSKPIFGLQFHPEVAHSKNGKLILSNFCLNIAQCTCDWTPISFIDTTIENILQKVGERKVILGLSGGVDSSVAAALLFKSIGDNLIPIFVDTGLLRKNEAQDVIDIFKIGFGLPLKVIYAENAFLEPLKGISDPEMKRKIIGKTFIEVFEKEASEYPDARFLAQGTLYPDVIESVSFKGPSATIKSHHNVGGLPEKMNLELIEPLRELFKDEVRTVGRELGLPESLIRRHPFPGPGLAVRILGEITKEKINLLQDVDQIFINELHEQGLYDSTWQAFAVLLPVQSVGVMGDERTYDYVCALRAVNSSDGMTADWTELPYSFLKRVSNRIINEVKGINRVVYDISSKPPATIEWE